MLRTLIVEDDDLVREALANSLRAAGHDVSVAENGRQALAVLGEQVADVVVLDIVMPEMDGLELISEIRDLRGETAIVAISGGSFGNTTYLKAAHAFGADVSLTKPFRPRELISAIDSVLQPCAANAAPSSSHASA